ncbi:MAG: L,D-transpeptidase family protein [Ginsengibacter sp.]
MKKIFLFILSVILLLACNNQGVKHENQEKKVKKISKRDISITPANSYNDLFLDSMDVVDFIAKDSIPDSISRRITSFYNTRNYQFAWFSSDGLSEQAMGFTSLLNFTADTSKEQKSLLKKLDGMMADSDLTVSSKDKNAINTELRLTQNFIGYTRNNFEKGYIKRKEAERFIPFKKVDAVDNADSLLNKKHRDDKYFSDINEPYKLLSDQLRKYLEIVKSNQWLEIPQFSKSIKPGESSDAIRVLKNDMFLTGDLAVKDSSTIYDAALSNAIKNFQQRNGFTPDGKISKDLLMRVNINPKERLKQILINMNRMRWLPVKPPGKLALVNIPEFVLHMYDGPKEVFSMPVVVGKEGHNTVLFSDRLTTIVFSPYWNVPPSIVKKEVVPGMQKDPNYLEAHNMETTGNEGGLPVVRQKPGDKNSLGKVKFLFPNIFNIYFHDTPAKSLFSKDQRAYSHGCIRLSDPTKMAEYLLQDDKAWTPEKINEAMNSGNEKFVQVKDPVPVFITYYTAWVDKNGQLNFRDDIYGHDKSVEEKMFIQ